MVIIYIFILFATFVLFSFNGLTNALCIKREIPEEKHPTVFRTINVLMLILLVSSYIDILFAV